MSVPDKTIPPRASKQKGVIPPREENHNSGGYSHGEHIAILAFYGSVVWLLTTVSPLLGLLVFVPLAGLLVSFLYD